MIEKETKAFARGVMQFLKDKPKSKIQALTHIWDRVIIAGWTGMVIFTSIVTNNVGIVLLILWSILILFFGIYLTAHRR